MDRRGVKGECDFSAGDSAGQVFLRGYNLTDELAYNHSSLLKQFVPLPDRSGGTGSARGALTFEFYLKSLVSTGSIKKSDPP